MLNSCLAVSTTKGFTPSLSASSSSTRVFSALDNWGSYWLLHSCWSFCVPVIINTFAVGLVPCSTSTITGRFLSSVCQDVSTCIIRTDWTRSSVFGCAFFHIYVDRFFFMFCVCVFCTLHSVLFSLIYTCHFSTLQLCVHVTTCSTLCCLHALKCNNFWVIESCAMMSHTLLHWLSVVQ